MITNVSGLEQQSLFLSYSMNNLINTFNNIEVPKKNYCYLNRRSILQFNSTTGITVTSLLAISNTLFLYQYLVFHKNSL